MTEKLASERVIVQAPMSYTGSAKRLMRISPFLVILVPFVWVVVTLWYLIFGILLVPYRMIRRGSRNRKRQDLQHREILEQTRPK